MKCLNINLSLPEEESLDREKFCHVEEIFKNVLYTYKPCHFCKQRQFISLQNSSQFSIKAMRYQIFL